MKTKPISFIALLLLMLVLFGRMAIIYLVLVALILKIKT